MSKFSTTVVAYRTIDVKADTYAIHLNISAINAGYKEALKKFLETGVFPTDVKVGEVNHYSPPSVMEGGCISYVEPVYIYPSPIPKEEAISLINLIEIEDSKVESHLCDIKELKCLIKSGAASNIIKTEQIEGRLRISINWKSIKINNTYDLNGRICSGISGYPYGFLDSIVYNLLKG